MHAGLRSRVAPLLVIAALLVTLLAGQAAADSLAPVGQDADTGRTLGRAGFAYLTGVRTYAAAVLWNRIDPLYHDYYEDIQLAEQTFMLPTIRAVVALDPNFEQPYYVAAWMLVRKGALEEGLELAELGVTNNPRSGLLLVNHAQILLLHAEDVDAAYGRAEEALAPDIYWRNLLEMHDSYAVVRSIFISAGDDVRAGEITQEMRRIDDEIDRLGIKPESH